MSLNLTTAPTLFVIDGGGSGTLDDVVLGVLAQPELSPCPVCKGQLDVVAGGVVCRECGSELLMGSEPSVAHAA